MECKSCFFFEAAPDFFENDVAGELAADRSEYGFCHRHAPRPIQFNPDAGLEATWPAVWEGEWCGEYIPSSKEATDG